MRHPRKAMTGAALAVLAALAAAVYWTQWRQPTYEPIKLRFATSLFLGEMLSFVAYDKGFFLEQGLEVELSYNTVGWQSLKQLVEGRAEVATVAELPIVYSALDRNKYSAAPLGDFVVVADMTVGNRAQAGVARRDRGIQGPADLRGKRIALPRATASDFFLDSMLRRHELTEADLTVVDMDITLLAAAIVRGEVDAILGWEPHPRQALQALGANGVVLELGQRYPIGWLVVFMKDFLRSHPDVAARMLRALVKAEAFALANPAESQQIVARHLKLDAASVSEGIKDLGFKIALSESLLVTMDEQARWAIRRGLARKQPLPNFRDYIDLEPLRQVKPEAISVIQ